MTAASERLRWAAEVVAPRPDDRLLEVGCGHGVLVGLLADRLTTGHVVGLDRSPTMITTAGRRNHAHVAAGRVRLLAGAFDDADVGGERFDRLVAFNVALFHRSAEPWRRVDGLLTTGGAAYVFHQLMDPTSHQRVLDGFTAVLATAGWQVDRVLRTETRPYPSVGVVVRRCDVSAHPPRRS